jgi:orotidine-5'-phosphate decarboxylase
MNKQQLVQSIRTKKNFLCVGLDTDLTKIPAHLLQEADPIFAFNKEIIDATREYCVSYKPNLAFYEAQGIAGWNALIKTVEYIGNEHFIILDAKRGDIGNTAEQYAKTFFETMPGDAVTIAPYMGEDAITPFLNYQNKTAIVLALTSNPGAADFQLTETNGVALYEQVLQKASVLGNTDNLMFVVGATRPEYFTKVRAIVPDHFLLVPGVGAQGGSLEEVYKYGANAEVGLIVNVSRQILFASKGIDFANKAGEVAKDYANQMSKLMSHA